MFRVEANGKKMNLDRIIANNIKVIDLISNVEANVQRIIMTARESGLQPFNGSRKSLKSWLIQNQGYDKYVSEVFNYFVDKCRI